MHARFGGRRRGWGGEGLSCVHSGSVPEPHSVEDLRETVVGFGLGQMWRGTPSGGGLRAHTWGRGEGGVYVLRVLQLYVGSRVR